MHGATIKIKKIVVSLENSYQKEESASNTTTRKAYNRVYMSLTAQANLQVVTQQSSS